MSYLVGYRGDHAAPAQGAPAGKRHGIHPLILAFVDPQLEARQKPRKIRAALLRRYSTVERMAALVPTTTMIGNRRATLMKKLGGGLEVDFVIDMERWALARLCSSRVDLFFGANPTTANECLDLFKAMTREQLIEPIVLRSFRHEFHDTEDNTTKMSTGCIATCRASLWYMLLSMVGQAGSLLLTTDGTYRLHAGGWTLVNLGSTRMSHKGKYKLSYVPWIYMLARSENQGAKNVQISTWAQPYLALRVRGLLEYV